MTQPLLLAVPDSDIAPVTNDAVISAGTNRMGGPSWLTGNISEKLFDLEATRRGWLVAINAGGAPDFDFIIKRPISLGCVVVQVKTPYWHERKKQYIIRACSNNGSYSSAAFDVLACYLREAGEWLFYTRAEIGARLVTSYTPPDMRQKATKFSAPGARQPNNWELLDDVAQSLTTSGGIPANV